VSRFVTYDVQVDAIPAAYVDAIWSLPAMQEWLADAHAEPDVVC